MCCGVSTIFEPVALEDCCAAERMDEDEEGCVVSFSEDVGIGDAVHSGLSSMDKSSQRVLNRTILYDGLLLR